MGHGSYDRPLPVLPQGVAPILLDLSQQNIVPTFHDFFPLLVHPQGGVPTLRDLCLLPVPNWYLLGLQLGLSADELDVIERNYLRDNRMCKTKMFAAWLRMDTSANYERLARALVTVGKRNIAEAMCTARGTKTTTLEYSIYYSVHALCCGAGWRYTDYRAIVSTNSDQLNVDVKTAMNFGCSSVAMSIP